MQSLYLYLNSTGKTTRTHLSNFVVVVSAKKEAQKEAQKESTKLVFFFFFFFFFCLFPFAFSNLFHDVRLRVFHRHTSLPSSIVRPS